MRPPLVACLAGLLAAGCCASPVQPEPSPAASSSVGAMARGSASGGAAPSAPAAVDDGRRVWVEMLSRGSRLVEPLVIEDDNFGGAFRNFAVALYGDPATQRVDSAWIVRAPDPGQAPRMQPVLGFPVATRLLGTRVHEGHLLVLLETLAAGGQPAGLRAIVRLNSWSAEEAPMHDGRAPSVGLDEAVATPLVDSTDVAVGKGEPCRLDRLVGPAGLAIEEVWQTYFRREVERIPREALGRWGEGARLERHLLCPELRHSPRVSIYDEARDGGSYRINHLARLKPWDDMTMARDGERAVVRSFGRAVPDATQRGAPSAELSPEQAREAIEGYLRSQPSDGAVLYTGALGPGLGAIGVVGPGAAGRHRPLLALVDGPVGMVLENIDLELLAEPGVTGVTLRPFTDGGGVRALMVHLQLPGDRGPWSGHLTLREHPLAFLASGWPERHMGDQLTSLARWGPDPGVNLAPSAEAAVARAQRPAPPLIPLAEARALVATLGTRRGIEEGTTPEAAEFTADSSRVASFFSGRGRPRRLRELTEAELLGLSRLKLGGGVSSGWYSTRGEMKDGEPSELDNELWFEREGGRWRLAALRRER